ncbi:hypothetical protein KAW64_09585, partial [bacterium]|nr:hypothetical protein [bacterium]
MSLDGAYLVEPGQRSYPISHGGPVEVEGPDPSIYNSRAAFPARSHDQPKVGFFRGYAIATLALHPVEYLPQDRQLSYWRSLDVRITTAGSRDAMAKTERMVRHDPNTVARLSGLVDNPLDASAYRSVQRLPGRRRDLDPAAAYKYIIITTDAWKDDLAPLVQFQTQRGLKATIALKSDILADYPTAVDEPDAIRRYIIDAYDAWDIDYVLLVGDSGDPAVPNPDGIPHRGLYATRHGFLTDSDIPADMYYGCLDGTWNSEEAGDDLWGEPGEADLYHEVGVGRASVSDGPEVVNFVTKTMRYQNAPIVSECDEVLLLGRHLDPDTWGGDGKDEIRFGSSANGYVTTGFPPSMNVGTLYEKYGWWSAADGVNALESGVNIVNNLSHGDWNMMAGITLPDVPSFDNDGLEHSYNFIYSQSCYTGSFDNRTVYGTYAEEDCLAEELLTDDDGAVAIISNSRYGLYHSRTTNGSSQMLDREFFDAMFGEGIYALADANDDSKMDVVWAMDYRDVRWCIYTLNLLGDPAMHLWTGEPSEVDLTYDDVLVGQYDMQVAVGAMGGGLVEGARVTVYGGD